MVWFRVVEEYLVRALLRSDAFHGAVRNIHKRVHGFQSESLPELKERLRDPAAYAKRQQELKAQQQLREQMHPDEKRDPGFLAHFWDELKEQARKR